MQNKSVITIAVHDGEFHADDVSALAALSLFHKGKTIDIVRTRNEAEIKKADYVVDVGGVYDPSTNRFDHHQIGGVGARENGVPYAAFGLVWKTYGEKIAGSKEAAEIIDQRLVQPIDAIDNGVSISKEIIPQVRPYDISSIIGAMNRNWNETPYLEKIFDAIELAKNIIIREILSAQAILEAEKYVTEVYEKTQDKRLIVLDTKYPWEKVIEKFPEPLYIVFPKEDNWRLKAVRSKPNSFENRKDLPKSWAGKKGAELVAVTGVPDAIFCHKVPFVAAAKSKEGALALAKIALEA